MMGPPPATPDPKKKPKDLAPRGNLSLISLVFTAILMVYVYASCVQHMNDVTPTPAGPSTSKPINPLPARVVDNGSGALVVYPPTMTSDWRAITDQMLAAEGEWQKNNPECVVVFFAERGDPADFYHCWIVHYRKK